MTSIRRVPALFEEYVQHERATQFQDGSQCPGCLEHLVAYSLASPFPGGEPTLICEPCLRNFHGHDCREEDVVRALLGGAVKAALALEIDVALIRAAVADAIDDEIEQQARYYANAERRAA
jgi:hypothetical protein